MSRVKPIAILILISALAVPGFAQQDGPPVPELEETPDRIVAAGRAVLMIADVLYTFPGVGEDLVAVGRIDQGRGNFLRAIDTNYGEKEILDRNVGPEQVAAQRPDLVILKSFMRETLGRGLERIGIPVLYVDLETPETYDRDLRRLGRVLKMEDRADAIRDYYRSEVDAVTQLTTVVAQSQRPRVLFAYAEPGDQGLVVNVPSAAWIQTSMVEMAGGNPIWADAFPGGGWHRVGLEQIAVWRPEVMFLVSYRNDVEAINRQLLENTQLGSTLETLGTDVHIVPIDFYSWDQPDVRWILGLKWMAKTLHPDVFSGLDLRDEVYRFYSGMYGLSREETDRVIFSRLTGLSGQSGQ